MWLLRIALAGLTAAAIGSVAGAAEPVKIRISWTAPVSNWGSLLMEKKDIARHLGRSYDLVPIRIGGSPPMITALATGELETSRSSSLSERCLTALGRSLGRTCR
jgi:sulfonate transport system substrate-binding protein